MLNDSVTRAKTGDAEAFKEIFDALNDRLFSYALSRTKNRDGALDIVQETFIDLWRALPTCTYSHDAAFRSFVFTILKRKIYRFRETKKETVSIDDVSANVEASILEDWRHLRKEVDLLSPRYREVLHLRYWKELSFKDIATLLTIKEGAAKVRHHRALSQLKNNTEKYNVSS